MKPGSLVVAYLHGGQVAHSFHSSCRGLWTHDLLHSQRLVGFISQECGAGRITDGRTDAVRKFLATEGEWLAFVDSDQGFDPDCFDRLIDAADPVQRPVVGALVFGQRRAGQGPHGSVRLQQFPTIYRWVDGPGMSGCAPLYDYPPDALVECDATGAACFVVHRGVLTELATRHPEPRPWFDELILRRQVFGEDLTFFRRVRDAGFRVHVHTGVKTSHYKQTYLIEDTQPPLVDIPTYVVIPMKDRMDLTRSVLEQLAGQDEYAGVFVFDNGSSPETKAQLAVTGDLPPRVEVFDAEGWNIHRMWNAGLAEALGRSTPCNVAILNNDLKIGPAFLSGLAQELRHDPLVAAVCPNYDGREGEGHRLCFVTDICADRYDGTGGLAGFAFMLKGESGYRFPEELNWWFGDNDLVATIHHAGCTAAIALGTTCEHIGGGAQTADWDDPGMRELLDADRAWFQAKWQPHPARERADA